MIYEIIWVITFFGVVLNVHGCGGGREPPPKAAETKEPDISLAAPVFDENAGCSPTDRDMMNSKQCSLLRQRGECLTNQVKMATNCYRTCLCKQCMIYNACKAAKDLHIQFAQVEEQQEKMYNYAVYTGNALQSDFRQSTICFRVTPRTLSADGTQQTFVNYAVAPEDAETVFETEPVKRGNAFDMLKLGASANKVFLTVDLKLTYISQTTEGMMNVLKLYNGDTSSICVTYDAETGNGRLFQHGKRGREEKVTDETTEFIKGGGHLVFGQDQRGIGFGGSAKPERVFEGTLSHFKMWTRVLTDEELTSVTKRYSDAPVDEAIDLDTTNVRLFGNTVLAAAQDPENLLNSLS